MRLRLGAAPGESDQQKDHRDDADDDATLEERHDEGEEPGRDRNPVVGRVRTGGTDDEGVGDQSDERGCDGCPDGVDDQSPLGHAADQVFAGNIVVEHGNVLVENREERIERNERKKIIRSQYLL